MEALQGAGIDLTLNLAATAAAAGACSALPVLRCLRCILWHTLRRIMRRATERNETKIVQISAWRVCLTLINICISISDNASTANMAYISFRQSAAKKGHDSVAKLQLRSAAVKLFASVRASYRFNGR